MILELHKSGQIFLSVLFSPVCLILGIALPFSFGCCSSLHCLPSLSHRSLEFTIDLSSRVLLGLLHLHHTPFKGSYLCCLGGLGFLHIKNFSRTFGVVYFYNPGILYSLISNNGESCVGILVFSLSTSICLSISLKSSTVTKCILNSTHYIAFNMLIASVSSNNDIK